MRSVFLWVYDSVFLKVSELICTSSFRSSANWRYCNRLLNELWIWKLSHGLSMRWQKARTLCSGIRVPVCRYLVFIQFHFQRNFKLNVVFFVGIKFFFWNILKMCVFFYLVTKQIRQVWLKRGKYRNSGANQFCCVGCSSFKGSGSVGTYLLKNWILFKGCLHHWFKLNVLDPFLQVTVLVNFVRYRSQLKCVYSFS